MSEGSNKYIGDMTFDELMKNPGFKETAWELVAKDWRTGSSEFRAYVEPLIEQFPFEATFPSWGEAHNVVPYLERRVMTRINPQAEPWLWAYFQMTGAFIKPDDARSVLNAIANTGK